MGRMRIALVTPGFSASERDWCIPVLLNLVRELARCYDVHVFTLRYPHRHQTYEVAGATVHPFGGNDVGGVARLNLLRRALTRLVGMHRDTPFDLIHGFWSDEPGFLAVSAGRLIRVPSLVSIMGGELVSLPEIGYGGQLSGMNPWLTRLALRGASRVTVGSRYLQTMARRYVPPERLRVVSLGVDTTLFSQLGSDRAGCERMLGNPALISVGSLVPVKGHRLMLSAIARVSGAFPDIHLHLVGDGPLRSELQSLARSLDLEQKITFHGEIPHHQLPDYYRNADLFVSSSLHESQGLAALEAAACGCPVVGTSVGILPELSPRSASIPAGDPEALASGVLNILNGGVDPRTVGENALGLVQAEFTLKASVDRLLGVYREVAGRQNDAIDEREDDSPTRDGSQ